MVIPKRLSRFGSPAWLLLGVIMWKGLEILDTVFAGLALMDSIAGLLSRDVLILIGAMVLLVLVIIWPELTKWLSRTKQKSDSDEIANRMTEIETNLAPILRLNIETKLESLLRLNQEEISRYVEKLRKLP